MAFSQSIAPKKPCKKNYILRLRDVDCSKVRENNKTTTLRLEASVHCLKKNPKCLGIPTVDGRNPKHPPFGCIKP